MPPKTTGGDFARRHRLHHLRVDGDVRAVVCYWMALPQSGNLAKMSLTIGLENCEQANAVYGWMAYPYDAAVPMGSPQAIRIPHRRLPLHILPALLGRYFAQRS